jgi:anti-repressor protein
MNQLSIAAFVGTINQHEATLINARDLHAHLGVETKFGTWIIRRIEDFGFVKNEDFTIAEPLPKNGKRENTGLSNWFGGENKIEYHITLDMAKELCMVERSDIGRAARRYFIEMEKEHRDAVPAWAIEQWSTHQAQLAAAQAALLQASTMARDVARLLRAGLSNAEIAKLKDCSETTVTKYRAQLKAAGLLNGMAVLRNGTRTAPAQLVLAGV